MAQKPADELKLGDVKLRLAGEEDHPIVRELFKAGLDEGFVAGNDTGADIEQLQEAYFSVEGQSGLWVAEYDSEVIGMIGVQKTSDHEAEIRRLRVRKDFRRRGVGTKLVEEALAFCARHDYVKVILDVRIERGPAISLFEKFGFQLARTREMGDRKMLDFYLDLYRKPSG